VGADVRTGVLGEEPEEGGGGPGVPQVPQGDPGVIADLVHVVAEKLDQGGDGPDLPQITQGEGGIGAHLTVGVAEGGDEGFGRVPSAQAAEGKGCCPADAGGAVGSEATFQGRPGGRVADAAQDADELFPALFGARPQGGKEFRDGLDSAFTQVVGSLVGGLGVIQSADEVGHAGRLLRRRSAKERRRQQKAADKANP
jgi:hypothetical protein